MAGQIEYVIRMMEALQDIVLTDLQSQNLKTQAGSRQGSKQSQQRKVGCKNIILSLLLKLQIWLWPLTIRVPYFFSYKSQLFSFQNNPKNQDLSYKMDLDFWDFLGRNKTRIIAKFHRTD